MEYNVRRKKLEIPEYGRNLQKMVDYALTIQEKEKRNTYAKIIIQTMSQVNPNCKEMADYKRTLWDHLHIMADYKLDVDCPYEKPTPEQQNQKPDKLNYKNSKIRFRPYGKNIENMIDKVIEMPEGEEKQTLIEMIAQQLKKSYLQWNINSCDDEMILSHFEQLSHGQLKLQEDFRLHSTKRLLSNNNQKKKNNQKQKQNNNNKNKHQKKN
jgi:hypothetical protein